MANLNVVVGGGLAMLTIAILTFIGPFIFAVLYGPADSIGGTLGVNNTAAWNGLDTGITNTSSMFGTGMLGIIGLALLGILLVFLGIKMGKK